MREAEDIQRLPRSIFRQKSLDIIQESLDSDLRELQWYADNPRRLVGQYDRDYVEHLERRVAYWRRRLLRHGACGRDPGA